MKTFRIFYKLLLWFNILSGLALLFGYAAPYIDPKTTVFPAFLGLALPYLLLLQFGFLFFWIVRGKKLFLLSLILIILGYKSIPNIIQFNVKLDPETEESFKVLSFNVRVFDLYMWTQDKLTRNQIFDFLDQEEPDILCLQEFYQADTVDAKYEFKTLDTLTKFLKAKNYHVEYTSHRKKIHHWGIITFSKFPIIKKGRVNFSVNDDNICIYTDLNVKGDTVRVFNAHLASIKLDKRDYKTIQGINQNEYSDNFSKELLMVEKIKYGFERRASQADSISKAVGNSPYPIILCGDFNDTPNSFAYATIKSNLKDAFQESGFGLGRTYIGDFPSFRIDYIFHSDTFLNHQFTTHDQKLSDHRPISSVLSIKK